MPLDAFCGHWSNRSDQIDLSVMHVAQAACIGMLGDIGVDEGAGFVGLGRPRLVPAHDVTGSRDAMHVAPRGIGTHMACGLHQQIDDLLLVGLIRASRHLAHVEHVDRLDRCHHRLPRAIDVLGSLLVVVALLIQQHDKAPGRRDDQEAEDGGIPVELDADRPQDDGGEKADDQQIAIADGVEDFADFLHLVSLFCLEWFAFPPDART